MDQFILWSRDTFISGCNPVHRIFGPNLFHDTNGLHLVFLPGYGLKQTRVKMHELAIFVNSRSISFAACVLNYQFLHYNRIFSYFTKEIYFLNLSLFLAQFLLQLKAKSIKSRQKMSSFPIGRLLNHKRRSPLLKVMSYQPSYHKEIETVGLLIPSLPHFAHPGIGWVASCANKFLF